MPDIWLTIDIQFEPDHTYLVGSFDAKDNVFVAKDRPYVTKG